MVRRLFVDGAAPLPCEGSLQEGGNLALLDVNGDSSFNLTDAIYLLSFLFLGGPPPPPLSPAEAAKCAEINRPPEIEPIGTILAREGAEISFEVGASDPDHDTIETLSGHHHRHRNTGNPPLDDRPVTIQENFGWQGRGTRPVFKALLEVGRQATGMRHRLGADPGCYHFLYFCLTSQMTLHRTFRSDHFWSLDAFNLLKKSREPLKIQS